jgi:hypothetical protein
MEPTVIEVDDSLALSSGGSPSLSPVQGTRRYQCRPLVLIIGMLIAGGMCVILLPTKSLQSADEIYCNQTINDSKINVNINSNFNQPLKRTHRVDSLGDTNLTYFDENGRINFDAFNHHISEFLQTVKTVEESLDAYSHTQTIMVRRELIRIMYQLEYDVQSSTKDLRNLQTRLINIS